MPRPRGMWAGPVLRKNSGMTEQELDKRVALLASAMSDPDPGVCWNAARELAKLGPRASAALPELARALRGHDATTALWARFAIVKITGETAKHLPLFLRALEDKRIYPGMAGFAIAGLGVDAREAVPILIRQLEDPNPDNRWSAAGALASMGAEARDAVPALREAIRDTDEKVRWYTVWALGEMGPEARDAVPELTAALDDFDDDVRGYAARALGRIGPDAAAAVPALRTLLEDENGAVCEGARAALELISQ